MFKFESQFIRSPQSLGWLIGGAIMIGVFIFDLTNVFLGDIISFILGGFVTIFLFGFVFKRRGAEIDFNNKKVRIYKSFWGRRSGEWRNYTEFPFFRIKNIIINTPGGIERAGYQTRQLGLLIYDKVNKESIVLLKSDRKTLLKLGTQLSLKLEMKER